jgi:hypothetical protein
MTDGPDVPPAPVPGASGQDGPAGPAEPAGPTPRRRPTAAVVGLVVGGVMLLLLSCAAAVVFAVSVLTDDYVVGECVREEKAGKGSSKAVRVECSEPGAYKIAEKIDDTTDKSRCREVNGPSFVNFRERYVLCLKVAGD